MLETVREDNNDSYQGRKSAFCDGIEILFTKIIIDVTGNIYYS